MVETLARVSSKHPHSAYAELQKSLQQEWAFVQRINPGIGEAFDPVDKALQETFLPELFEELREETPKLGVTRLIVKQAGLDLPDPTLTSPENWTASFVVTGHRIAALRGWVEFRTADHSACLREGRAKVWRRFGGGVNSGQRMHWWKQ